MTRNDEFVQKMSVIHDYVMRIRKDSDYIVNQPQMDKLTALVEFFIEVSKRTAGNVLPVDLRPAAEHGGVVAHFWYFNVAGSKVKSFCDVAQHCSAISIDALDTGEVCISCTIPNVFVRKDSL